MAQALLIAPESQDLNTLFSYPTDTVIIKAQNTSGEIHLIWGSDASPVTNHNNAPNGSVYFCLHATAGNNKVWLKFGTLGANDGTFRATGQLT